MVIKLRWILVCVWKVLFLKFLQMYTEPKQCLPIACLERTRRSISTNITIAKLGEPGGRSLRCITKHSVCPQ